MHAASQRIAGRRASIIRGQALAATDGKGVMRPFTEGFTKVVAIGETGLDYHHLPSEAVSKEEQVQVMTALRTETDEEIEAQIRDGAYKSKQASLFQQQLDLAVELGLKPEEYEHVVEILVGELRDQARDPAARGPQPGPRARTRDRRRPRRRLLILSLSTGSRPPSPPSSSGGYNGRSLPG